MCVHLLKRAAEEIAHREKCEDFELFEELFERVERELKAGSRQTRPFGNNVSIEVGHWFILSGQMAYVAEEGEDFDSPQGKKRCTFTGDFLQRYAKQYVAPVSSQSSV